jgi:hypothetical protein
MSSLAKATNATDSTLNVRADKLLAEYSRINPQLELGIESTKDQDVNAMIGVFGEFVQSLVNMEVPLGLIEPPPMYEERFGDQVVLNIEGQLLQDLE